MKPAVTILISLVTLFMIGSVLHSEDSFKLPLQRGDGFGNPWRIEERGFPDLMKWYFNRLTGESESGEGENKPPPRVSNNGRELALNRSAHTITWIGHSTVLIQVDGYNIITDPIFGNLSVNKRKVAPGISLENLPPIDAVLISHNHYDHLDQKSLQGLKGKPTVFVGRETGDLVRSWGIENVVELDWWQEHDLNGLTIAFLPAQHWSMRMPWNRNEMLWGSWLVKGSQKTFYFAGDTGYFPDFVTIGQKYPSIDVALLPIGAFAPRWFMRPHHMSPEDAGKAFLDLGAKNLLPVHYGTFVLSDELLDVPAILMQRWWSENITNAKRELLLPALGETIKLPPSIAENL
jgi:N-acyl-phosphatidylethanolamine-hydrolysing phospholipase D